MKICFPVEVNNGLHSNVFGHFGSAPIFLVFNTETDTFDEIKNCDLEHTHGMCNPLKALGGQMVDAIVVGGIGAGAVRMLNRMGIKVYRASCGTIQENLQQFKCNTMLEITVEYACGGHTGGCDH